MNFQQCRYAVAIAEAGSFSQAAKELFVTQSSLSTSIKELESSLGIILFHRSKSGVRLTEAGSEFLVAAKRILAQVELLETQYQPDKKKDFVVTAQHYDFLSQPFLAVFQQFQADCQNFHLVETTTQKIIESLQTFRSELGILYLTPTNQRSLERHFAQEQLIFQPLGQFVTQIFLRKDHPLAQKDQITETDLIDYPQIRFTQEEYEFSHFDEDPLEIPTTQSVIYTNDRGTLLNLLCGSDAYASGLGIVEGFAKDQIVLKPLADSAIHTLGAVYHQQRSLSEMATLFLEKVQEAVDHSATSIDKIND
ncbi:LysR family transcriptional regulator [Enterococcus sp. AZ109]|uniref:LysR family transcriptional regulator n=1 Tax=Enterococcus sp. AZ109 TaxID=2774634 RepID=UPI003F207808